MAQLNIIENTERDSCLWEKLVYNKSVIVNHQVRMFCSVHNVGRAGLPIMEGKNISTHKSCLIQKGHCR